MSNAARAALGFRAHSGWAGVVVVAGPRSPTVIDRRRIELIGPGIPKQPYHAAEKLDLKEAEKLVGRRMAGARCRVAAISLIARIVSKLKRF
jgi:hypothetical protein